MTMNFKSFARGVGSILDIFPADNNRSGIIKHESLSDEEALKNDAQAIEQDFKKAMGYINGENKKA
jgi:hypothetical protein